MKDKIVEALKKAGLDEGLVEKIRVKDESEIEGAVSKLKARSDFMGLVKESGLEDAYRAEIDSAISKGNDKLLDRLEREGRLVGQDKKPDEKPDNKDDENVKSDDTAIAAFEKLLNDKLSPVLKTVEGLSAKDREGNIKARLKSEKLPENFSKFITGSTDDEISEQIKEYGEQYSADLQAEINAKIDAGEYVPKSGSAGDSVTMDKVKEFAKNRESNGFGDGSQSDFTGGKLNIDKD